MNGNDELQESLPNEQQVIQLHEPSTGEISPNDVPTDSKELLRNLMIRAQKTMAHAWMVRTFVKHSDEVEDYPDLNEMARTIFDTFRALETQVDDPESYFKVVRKKIGKLKSAAQQFEKDAWHASTHTNFQQAVISAKYVSEQLAELLAEAGPLLPKPPAPPSISRPQPGQQTVPGPQNVDPASVPDGTSVASASDTPSED